MELEIRELKPTIGSEIIATKQDLLSGEYGGQLRDLLEQRGVLVFPEINFSDDEQVAFTKTLGQFAPEMLDGGGESVHRISLDKSQSASADYLRGSMYWHLDGTMNEVPILASILSAKVLTPTGGDTEFCNTYAAYAALPESEQEEYDHLKVMHSAWNTLFYYEPETGFDMLDQMMAIGENELPLVWKHRSGRKSLVLGCTAYQIVDFEHKESIRLLVKLRDWATRPEYVYRHKWSVGDTVIWDNTGTMHRALPYDPGSGRLMHRTKLEGEEAFA
ncbi:MAG: TauD/TfdA family dioxygenase [Halieaceae bacterium]|nr:TauD/TfdA family dioxygenase [Halieaceae bacterium]